MTNLNLAKLKNGKKGKIVSINLAGPIRRRLFDLGLVPGTVVESMFDSFLKDPTAYMVRGKLVGIRQQDAQMVVIENIDE